MPPRKRKVKELGGVEGEEPRRSSRRKAAVKDEPVAVASEQSRPVERKEPRKKGTKKEETKKETKDGTKGVEHEVDSTVSLSGWKVFYLPTYLFISSSLPFPHL